MPLDKNTGRFVIQAVLNDGWCTSGDEWIRSGDYKNAFRTPFELTGDKDSVTVQIELEQYSSGM